MTPFPQHPRGVQRRWSPEDALEPPASSPGEQVSATPGGWEGPRNADDVPFSTLKCYVPEPWGGGGLPGNPGRGLGTRSPPLSSLPGPKPEGAASPASRTSPARRAGARSASVGRAPPRPPSCADATWPRPLTSFSLVPVPGFDQWRCRGSAGGRQPEGVKGLSVDSCGRARRRRSSRGPARKESLPAPRPLGPSAAPPQTRDGADTHCSEIKLRQ